MRGGYPERIGQPECQGEPLCAFYSRYGICKFGSNCKFHHPTTISLYGIASPSSSYPAGVLPIQNFVASSSGEEPTVTALPSSQVPVDADANKSRQPSITEAEHLASSDDIPEAEV